MVTYSQAREQQEGVGPGSAAEVAGLEGARGAQWTALNRMELLRPQRRRSGTEAPSWMPRAACGAAGPVAVAPTSFRPRPQAQSPPAHPPERGPTPESLASHPRTHGRDCNHLFRYGLLLPWTAFRLAHGCANVQRASDSNFALGRPEGIWEMTKGNGYSRCAALGQIAG